MMEPAWDPEALRPVGIISVDGKTSQAISIRVSDIDYLIQVQLLTLALSQPWHRELREQLDDADRCTIILKVCLLLARSRAELHDAASHLCRSLQTAFLALSEETDDEIARANIGVALHLAMEVGELLAPAG